MSARKLAAAPSPPSSYFDVGAETPGELDVNSILDRFKAPEPAKEEPGLVESGLRGIKQGVTFGFGDELTGALESAFTSKTYRQARDEARANDEAARNAHPVGFGLGQVLGGLATAAVPIGAAGEAASLGAAAARGIAAGGVTGLASGLGESKADLTQGDFAGAAKDTAIGGATGAALGGALGAATHGLIVGAPARADKTLLSDIGNRATPTTRARLAGSAEDVVDTSRQLGLDKVARNPEKLMHATDAAKKAVGGEIGSIYAAADAKSPGVSLTEITKALRGLEKEYRENPATKSIAAKVSSLIDDTEAAWKDQYTVEKGITKVPAAKVQEFATSIGDKGFAGSGLEPTVLQEMQQKAWGAVKDTLNKHVEDAVPDMAGDLRKLNRHYSVLIDIGKAAVKRASVDAFAPSGIRQIAQHGLQGVGVVGAAMGHPAALLAPLAMPAAKAVGRVGTTALAALVKASQAGSVPATLIRTALEQGIPRAIIESIVSKSPLALAAGGAAWDAATSLASSHGHGAEDGGE